MFISSRYLVELGPRQLGLPVARNGSVTNGLKGCLPSLLGTQMQHMGRVCVAIPANLDQQCIENVATLGNLRILDWKHCRIRALLAS